MCPAGKSLNCSCLRAELVRESSGHETFFHYIWNSFCAPCITGSLWHTHAGEKEHTDVKHLAGLSVKHMNQLLWVGQKVSLKVWCLQQGQQRKSLMLLWSGNGDLQQEPKEENRKNRKRVPLYHCPRGGILVFSSPHWIFFFPDKFAQFPEAGCIF